MVSLPEDTQLVGPAIAPFRTRRRKAKAAAPADAATAADGLA